MSAAAAAAPIPPRMMPGDYLRLRRIHTGLSVVGLARAVVSSPVDLCAAAVAIAEAEAGRVLLGDADVARLAPVLSLDRAIYDALIDDMPAFRLCASCGGGEGRLWVDRDETLCAACWTANVTPKGAR